MLTSIDVKFIFDRVHLGLSSLRADTLNLVYSSDYIHTICDTWAGCTAG